MIYHVSFDIGIVQHVLKLCSRHLCSPCFWMPAFRHQNIDRWMQHVKSLLGGKACALEGPQTDWYISSMMPWGLVGSFSVLTCMVCSKDLFTHQRQDTMIHHGWFCLLSWFSCTQLKLTIMTMLISTSTISVDVHGRLVMTCLLWTCMYNILLRPCTFWSLELQRATT